MRVGVRDEVTVGGGVGVRDGVGVRVGVGVLVGVVGLLVGVRVTVAVGVLISAKCSRASFNIAGLMERAGRSSNLFQYSAAFFRSSRVS